LPRFKIDEGSHDSRIECFGPGHGHLAEARFPVGIGGEGHIHGQSGVING
jgi:hypothetical protein